MSHEFDRMSEEKIIKGKKKEERKCQLTKPAPQFMYT